MNRDLQNAYSDLSTPLLADACLRLCIPLRICPPMIRPVPAGECRMAGRVLPVKHYGSVDIFLEAMGSAQEGDILVIDNKGRMDEACIGDLTALEAKACGLAGIIVWGCHRDTHDLKKIAFPVFSCGPYPAGPLRLDRREPDAFTAAVISGFTVSDKDIAFGDLDGVLFVPIQSVHRVIATAHGIWQTERIQAARIRAGVKLRDQLQFHQYLNIRSEDPAYTFRKHLHEIGGAIEQ